MSYYDEKSYDFLIKLRKFLSKLTNEIATFTPHYALWTCPSCKETNFTLSTDNCLSNGRYCAPDGDMKSQNNVLGKEVVYEDLTQLCLYELDKSKWLDYVEGFYNNCFKRKIENFNLRKCSESVYTLNHYDKEKVETCINDSFIDRSLSNRHDGENILLSQEQKTFMTEGIQSWPTLRVNNETYRV